MFGIGNTNNGEEQKKGVELYSVIKNDRPSDELVWKCLKEDFNTNTQLIVMESEEALFVKDGVVIETFTGGKYTLSTENYPFISGLRKLVSGGESAYSCSVYFVDKSHKLELLWGTDSPIQMTDAKYEFSVGVRARGSYSIQIQDAKKFFIKLVGNTFVFTKEEIQNQFRTVFQTKIKVAVATVMKQSSLTVLDMNTELENIGEKVKEQLIDVLDEYGIRLVNFYISDISIPEDDPMYKIINETYAKSYAGNIELRVQGEGWNKLTAKELAKDLANNPGAGGTAAVGAGIGMGVASAGVFGNIANQLFSPLSDQNANNNNTNNVQQQQSRVSRFAPKSNTISPQETNSKTKKCPTCGNNVPENSKFCGECGTKLEDYICKVCGEKVPTGSKFCGNCGTRREENEG